MSQRGSDADGGGTVTEGGAGVEGAGGWQGEETAGSGEFQEIVVEKEELQVFAPRCSPLGSRVQLANVGITKGFCRHWVDSDGAWE